MIKLTPLHINTEYSLLESTIRIDDLINLALKEGLTSLAITDHNNMFGVADFVYKCKKNNIKPIVGLDLDVENYRLVLLAKNYFGYQELSRLSSMKMNGNEITSSEIKFDNLFVIDHPTFGYFAKTKKQLDVPNYFVHSDQNIDNALIIYENKIMDVMENRAIMILESISNSGNISSKHQNLNEISFVFDENDYRTQNAKKIIDSIDIVFPKDKNILPSFPIDSSVAKSDYFWNLLISRINKEFPENPAYLERAKYEFEIIDSLNFVDYFLIIWDLIKWSKSRGIAIGPGRGSAAGSLVSYLLNITEINPLEHNLLFERFLNPERVSMPDIDIDIQDNRREEVINYLFDKYGQSSVGLISTFSKIGAKTALRDVARVNNYPVRDIDAISKMIPTGSNLGEAHETSSRFRAAVNKKADIKSIYEDAKLIEGLPRQQGTHAAGVVISNFELINKVPIINGLGGHNQIQFSMDHLESFGLLKIDLLGLRNLTIIQEIQEEIKRRYNRKVDLRKLPLNDKKTNELLSKGDTSGVFQLESYGMKKTLVEVGVSSFDDLVAIISLFRPGPMEYIADYASVKKGKKKIQSITSDYDNIVKETNGIIVYQEQIMQIAQKISGMTFGQADILRRAISKKKLNLIDSLKSQFISGAIKNNYTLDVANNIFSMIEKFANYGFNKSHAVAYGTLSYRLAFLKARFPLEFYTAIIQASLGSQAQVKKYTHEAVKKGIKIAPPNINSSQERVYSKNNTIFLPLIVIKGFGEAANKKFIVEQEHGPFKTFYRTVARLKNSGLGDVQIQTLIQSGAMRDFGNTTTLTDAFDQAIRFANMISKNKEGEIDFESLSEPRLIEKERDLSLEEKNENKYFGFNLSFFKTQPFEKEIKIMDIPLTKKAVAVASIQDVKKLKDKNGNDFAILKLKDSISEVEAIVFASVYEKLSKFKKGSIIEVELQKRSYNGSDSYSVVSPWKVLKDE